MEAALFDWRIFDVGGDFAFLCDQVVGLPLGKSLPTAL